MELARQKQARIFAAQIRIETLKALGHLALVIWVDRCPLRICWQYSIPGR